MKVRDFYETMKEVLQDPVSVMKGREILYNDFIVDSKIYEYILDYDVKSVYIGKDNSIIVEV